MNELIMQLLLLNKGESTEIGWTQKWGCYLSPTHTSLGLTMKIPNFFLSLTVCFDGEGGATCSSPSTCMHPVSSSLLCVGGVLIIRVWVWVWVRIWVVGWWVLIWVKFRCRVSLLWSVFTTLCCENLTVMNIAPGHTLEMHRFVEWNGAFRVCGLEGKKRVVKMHRFA